MKRRKKFSVLITLRAKSVSNHVTVHQPLMFVCGWKLQVKISHSSPQSALFSHWNILTTPLSPESRRFVVFFCQSGWTTPRAFHQRFFFVVRFEERKKKREKIFFFGGRFFFFSSSPFQQKDTIVGDCALFYIYRCVFHCCARSAEKKNTQARGKNPLHRTKKTNKRDWMGRKGEKKAEKSE